MGRFLAALAAMTAPASAGPAPSSRFAFATVALGCQRAAGIDGAVTCGKLEGAELTDRGEVAFFSDAMPGPGVDLTNARKQFSTPRGECPVLALEQL